MPPKVMHMSPAHAAFDEELARARLAFISAGQPALGAPRRAVDDAGGGAPVGRESSDAPEAREPGSAGGIAQVTKPEDLLKTRILDRFHLTTRQMVAVLLLLLFGALVALLALNRSSASPLPVVPSPVASASEPATPMPSPSPATLVRVHVLGAVASPSVVTVTDTAIVQDAVLAAGGMTADADPADLNLAAPVTDGQQVIVGTTAEPRGEVVQQSGAPVPGQPAGPVNLNTASETELEELPGVGPVLAGQIVAWREENSGFSSVAELQEVSGIGPKSFAKLEPLVST